MKFCTVFTFSTMLAASLAAHGVAAAVEACSATANSLQRQCMLEGASDLSLATAVCINRVDTANCVREARSAYSAALANCNDVREARDDVCDAVGEARYLPAFGAAFAANFVHPNDIGHGVKPNPYLPIVAGNKWVYEKPVVNSDGENVKEVVTVVVSNDTKLIDGIQCRVVHDTVVFDGEVIEDTDDWLAQDKSGNVWYCGELVRDYEVTDGDKPEVPELFSTAGTFKAGRDGALPGILMFAAPKVGTTYREEASWNNAEDLSTVLSITASANSPFVNCVGNCLETLAFTPKDPGVNEHKWYLPGVGQIAGTKDGEPGLLVLRSFTRGPK